MQWDPKQKRKSNKICTRMIKFIKKTVKKQNDHFFCGTKLRLTGWRTWGTRGKPGLGCTTGPVKRTTRVRTSLSRTVLESSSPGPDLGPRSSGAACRATPETGRTAGACGAPRAAGPGSEPPAGPGDRTLQNHNPALLRPHGVRLMWLKIIEKFN